MMIAAMDRESASHESNSRRRPAPAARESVKFHVTRRAFFRVAGILGLVFGSGLHGAFAGTKTRRSLGSPERGSRSTAPTLVVGLEIGTSKICIAVGERSRDGRIKLLSIGQAPSAGVRKGEIVDLDAAAKGLRKALADAETKSDVLIRRISVGVTGAHIQSFNNSGVVFLGECRDSISAEDIKATGHKAHDVRIPARNDFLHTRPQRYRVNNQICLLDPIGLPGQKLEADFHIIYGERTRFLKTIRCVKELPLEVEDVVFTALASADVVLTQDQKNRGALVIDLGAGTTGYILYADGAVTQSGMLAIGGDHITIDLSMGLGIPLTLAEELKVKEGSVTLGKCPPEEIVSWEIRGGVEPTQIRRESLNKIIHLRVRGTLEALKQRLADRASPTGSAKESFSLAVPAIFPEFALWPRRYSAPRLIWPE